MLLRQRPIRDCGLFGALGKQRYRGLSPFKLPLPVVGAIVPHISYDWGKPLYHDAFRIFAGCGKYDVVYVIGFDHYHDRYQHSGRGHLLFHATRRSYEIDEGEIPVCQDSLDVLEREFGPDLLALDVKHDKDWTIDNALAPLFFAQGGINRIVPIIVTQRIGMFRPDSKDYPATERFVRALVASVNENIRGKQRVLLLAGVDLAHCGDFFGDSWLERQRIDEIRAIDGAYLDCVFRLDMDEADEMIGNNETRSDAPGPVGVVGRVLKQTKLANGGEIVLRGEYHGSDDRFVTLATGIFTRSG